MRFSATLPSSNALDAVCDAYDFFGTLIERFRGNRSCRVVALLIGVWLGNAWDLCMTLAWHGQGLLHEQNPLALHALSGGPATLALYKIGLVLIGSYFLLKFRRARISEVGAFVVLVAYAVVAVRWYVYHGVYAAAFSYCNHFAAVDPTTLMR
jgi:hypothetical protein